MNASTDSPLFGALWLLATALVFLAPLIPSLRELFSRSDAGALDIDHLDNGRTDYAAQSVREQLPSLEDLPQAAGWPRTTTGLPIVPPGHERLMAQASQPLVLAPHAGAHTLVSSTTVYLRAHSRVERILHARSIRSRGPVDLASRTSADGHVTLSPGTRFERLSAACICSLPLRREGRMRAAGPASGIPLTVAHRRHDGDLRIPAGATVQGGLVVTGDLYLEDGVVVIGHVKVHGSATLGREASVRGALFALQAIHTEGDNHIDGPLCAGQALRLGTGSRVGSPAIPCSVSSWSMEVGASVRIYGSLSTVRGGEVLP
ncbi:MAG: hypothetical protein ACN6O3_00620 [Comamonas sp.]